MGAGATRPRKWGLAGLSGVLAGAEQVEAEEGAGGGL